MICVFFLRSSVFADKFQSGIVSQGKYSKCQGNGLSLEVSADGPMDETAKFS